LKKKLLKTQQCSHWSCRPLSPEQIIYGAIDAAVLRVLLRRMIFRSESISDVLGGNPIDVAASNDDDSRRFANITKTLRQSVRYTCLDIVDAESEDILISSETRRYSIQMGGIREHLSHRIARQCWPTGSMIPDLPTIKVFDPARAAAKDRMKKERKSNRTKRKKKEFKSRKLSTIPAKLDDLPRPGTPMGYTKWSCAEPVIGQDFIESLPDDTNIAFPGRGGVIEMQNAWLLFINFGGFQTNKYCNEFREGGRTITFSVSASRNFRVLETVVKPTDSRRATTLKKLLLFARPDSRDTFINCGVCEYRSWEKNDFDA